MSHNALIETLNELNELKALQADLQAEIDALQDQLKAHMTDTAQDSMTVGNWAVTYKDVTSTRMDTAGLKKDFPTIYAEYGKVITTKRFTVKAK